MKPDRTDRVVLVTGASRGLGRSAALHLNRLGFQVFGGVRKDADGVALEEASGGDVRPVRLDVTEPASIEAARERVAAACGDRGLGALVNNAGVLVLGPVETTPMREFRRAFEVNLFGLLEVTRAFLPLLRRAGGRIVNVSSMNGILSMPYAGAYCGSKFALEAVSDALRMELKPWGIGVAVVQPGFTASAIRRTAIGEWLARHEHGAGAGAGGPGAEAQLYGEVVGRVADLGEELEASAAGHEAFCEAVAHAITAEAPRPRYPAGPDTPGLMELAARPAAERDEALLAMWR